MVKTDLTPELPLQPREIDLRPALGNLAVLNPPERHAAEFDAVAGRGDAAPWAAMPAAPDEAAGDDIALGHQAFGHRRQVGEGRVHGRRVCDHLVGAHPLARRVVEEVGRELRADRIGIVAVGHGVVMREHKRLVGVEGGVGHRNIASRRGWLQKRQSAPHTRIARKGASDEGQKSAACVATK